MNYSAIKKYDIANGGGVRTSLFVSGCRNRCEGCFQPETWNFEYGSFFDTAAEDEVIESLAPDYIQGLTLLGGDPFEEENQEALLPFLKRVRERYPKKDIWAFTGYLLEDLLSGGRKHTEATDEMLSCIDILVDGPFVQAQKNLCLKFRGSENQRLIDMNEFRRSKRVVCLTDSEKDDTE